MRNLSLRRAVSPLGNGITCYRIGMDFSCLMEKVNFNGPLPSNRPDLGPCCLWTNAPEHKGYGQMLFQGKVRKIHRIIWEEAYGPIEKGYELHHICERKLCVNLGHLETLTSTQHKAIHKQTKTDPGQNNRRKTCCPKGHSY